VIRINLLATERKAAHKKFAFDPARQVTAVCGAILVLAGLVVGWRFWLVRIDEQRTEARHHRRAAGNAAAALGDHAGTTVRTAENAAAAARHA
jgi:hypothetical protein